MPDKRFFDTNILIYTLAERDPRCQRAEELIAECGVTSVQVLNEFASVARRKLRMSWNDVKDALQAIRTLCPGAVPLTIDTHDSALHIAVSRNWGPIRESGP